MTPQADWVKELSDKFVHRLDDNVHCSREEMEEFISKVESLAQQRTEKKWRLKCKKLQPPMEDDEETTVYRHCDEGDHWKCGGYGENGTCLCKCHVLSDLLK